MILTLVNNNKENPPRPRQPKIYLEKIEFSKFRISIPLVFSVSFISFFMLQNFCILSTIKGEIIGI